MAKMKGAIVVDTERCKGCQLCIIACPQKVIALANKVNLHGYPYVEAVNEEACVGCACCYSLRMRRLFRLSYYSAE